MIPTSQPTPPRAETEQETGARPKVLRRPPQFSRKSAPVFEEPMAETTNLPALAKPPARPAYAAGWQEDGRFGLALILVVAITNLMLALILPQLQHAPQSEPRMITLSHRATMPSAIADDRPSRITIYSESVHPELAASAQDPFTPRGDEQ